MKLHQHFEFGPASQDTFSFCQIQLALDTVCGRQRAKFFYHCRQQSLKIQNGVYVELLFGRMYISCFSGRGEVPGKCLPVVLSRRKD